MGSYSVFKRKEILTHATAWMSLEDFMLRTPVTKRQTLYNSNYVKYLGYSNSETERKMVGAIRTRGKHRVV